MTSEDKRAELLSRIVDGLVDDPRKVELDAQTMPRRVNWRVKVDINDTGKVIGKGGSHLDSLRVLVGLMGQRFGEDWRLKVDDPDDAPRVEKERIPEARGWSCEPALALLQEILSAVLDFRPTVEITGRTTESCATFVVRAASVQDYERLVSAWAIPDGKQLTPVAALGTLFRALGRQQGARIVIEVPGR